MANLKDIVLYLDAYLENDSIKDDSWNGLQVEGKDEVNKIIFAVDAGIETFERAVKERADMVVVHHGMFWRSSNPSIREWNKRRIAILLPPAGGIIPHGISLYASHLPLDKHPEVGNNAQLLKILDFQKECDFGFYAGQTISFIGRTKKEKTLEEIEQVLQKDINATCKTLPFGPEKISRIAVCSGGGAGFALFMEAVNVGVDLYLTGDSTEMYHIAKDIGINVIFAGHHATEIVGVRALAEVVHNKFGIETLFVDLPTGL
jgi:dinuclear metal center YbgI/SA1388 family protein